MLSLIIPVYKNEESIPELLEAVEEVHAGTPDGFGVIFVVDGSPDNSLERLRELLPGGAYRSRLISLSRNFGSFAAIRAGLEVGAGERFAIMAADLQEPADLPLRMDEVLQRDEADVVFGVRESRKDPTASRLPAQWYWAIYRRLVVKEIPEGGVDVFACTREVRDRLLELDERSTSLVAQLAWVGYRRATVSYERRERPYGSSAWTVGKKLTYLFDSIFAFTDLPIRLLVWGGGLVALLAGLYGLLVLLLRLFGSIEVPGFTVLALLIVFFGALILFGLGIVGSYASRAYENTKARPHYLIASIEDHGPTPDDDAS